MKLSANYCIFQLVNFQCFQIYLQYQFSDRIRCEVSTRIKQRGIWSCCRFFIWFTREISHLLQNACVHCVRAYSKNTRVMCGQWPSRIRLHIININTAAIESDENHSRLYDLYLRLPQRRPLASSVRPNEEGDIAAAFAPSIFDSECGLFTSDSTLAYLIYAVRSSDSNRIYMHSDLSSILGCSGIIGWAPKTPRSSGCYVMCTRQRFWSGIIKKCTKWNYLR